MIPIYEAFSVIAVVLSIWNTTILYKRKIINENDFRDLIAIVKYVASLTPIKADDDMVKKIDNLIAKYGGNGNG